MSLKTNNNSSQLFDSSLGTSNLLHIFKGLACLDADRRFLFFYFLLAACKGGPFKAASNRLFVNLCL